MYKAVERPAAIYDAECHLTTNKCEHTLHTMEMKMPLGLTGFDHVGNELSGKGLA